MHGTEEASNDGMVRVRIIHGLNISHKELTYLLQKYISYQNKVLCACSQGDILVGKDHRSSPTATHKEDNQITPHVSNLLHNGYHTCMLRDLQSSTQVFLKFTITQLAHSNITTFISQNNYQVSNFSYYSMHIFMKVFIVPILDAYHIRTNFIAKANYLVVLKDSQNNISES